MKTIYLDPKSPRIIGRRGDDNSVCVRADVEQWYTDLVGGTGTLLFTNPRKITSPLEANLTEVDGKHYLEAMITDYELQYAGWGVITAAWYDGTTMVYSRGYSVKVLTNDSQPVFPEKVCPDWVKELIEELGNAREAIEAAAEVIEQLEPATESMETAEAWAVGKRSGVNVGSDDPTYQNNSKYYKEQAQTAGLAAVASAEDAEAWAVGTRGGDPVSSDDDTHENNAAYWAGEAADSATAAAGSATAASYAKTAAQAAQTAAEGAAEAVTAEVVGAWLEENVDPSTGYVIDNSLTVANAAADAKVVGDAFDDVKGRISGIKKVTVSDVDCLEQLGAAKAGHWAIENNVATKTEGSGSYFAYNAFPVQPGELYTLKMNANSSYPAVILANYSEDEYRASQEPLTVESNGRCEFEIFIPETGVSHLLITKYGSTNSRPDLYWIELSRAIQKTDKTLLLDNVAADAKAVGDKFAEVEDIKTQIDEVKETIQDELYEEVNLERGTVAQGYIDTDGVSHSGQAHNLYKINVSSLVGKTVVCHTEKAQVGSDIAMLAFYNVDYEDAKRDTEKIVVGVGKTYSANYAGSITEEVVVPENAKTMFIAVKKSSEIDWGVKYYRSANIKEQIIKYPYQSGNIFFTVDCPRPIPFGEGEYTEQDYETIECVLRLPESYQASGKPTRLVLACHGAGGYIKQEDNKWYNTNWIHLMDALTAAGYAVFDANIFAWDDEEETEEDDEESENTIQNPTGYALGSPLYAQALKYAYDYIQEHYNVYPQIFAHGTSMGGVGAKTFTHLYPNLVLARSSFAGRDICLYLQMIKTRYRSYVRNGDTPQEAMKKAVAQYYRAYGYDSAQELVDDHFSHCVGISDSLGIKRINNGVYVGPPDRETDFVGWLEYYADLNSKSRGDADLDNYIGHTAVPYKAWNAWSDDPEDTAQEVLMAKAYEKTNSAPYYAVTYTLTNEETSGSTAHTVMSYGQVRNMRDQLIAWYRRWE